MYNYEGRYKMGADKIQYITAMTVYIGAVIAIGFYYAKKASENSAKLSNMIPYS